MNPMRCIACTSNSVSFLVSIDLAGESSDYGWGCWRRSEPDDLDHLPRETLFPGNPCGAESIVCGVRIAIGLPVLSSRSGDHAAG
jgi:hypothetical protein